MQRHPAPYVYRGGGGGLLRRRNVQHLPIILPTLEPPKFPKVTPSRLDGRHSGGWLFVVGVPGMGNADPFVTPIGVATISLFLEEKKAPSLFFLRVVRGEERGAEVNAILRGYASIPK